MKLYEYYAARNKVFIDLEKQNVDTILSKSSYNKTIEKINSTYKSIDDLCPHTGRPLALINAEEASLKNK